MKPLEIANLTLQDQIVSDVTERREQRKEHKYLSQGKFFWKKIFDSLCIKEIDKMYDSRWIKLHTLLCMLQLDDPKYQNFFIEQFGEKFDQLPNNLLLQFASNMAIAGLN